MSVLHVLCLLAQVVELVKDYTHWVQRVVTSCLCLVFDSINRYLWIQDHVQRGTFKVGKIPGSLNKADVGTKHVAREDLLRHTRALGLREWQAPDENPRDMSTITNLPSMMWPRIFYRKKHA